MADVFGELVWYLPADGAQPPTRTKLEKCPVSEDLLPDGIVEEGGDTVFRIMVAKSDVPVVREDDDRVERGGEIFRVSRIVSDAGEVWDLECV